MHFTPVQMIGTQRSGSNLLRLMLNQLDGVSAPHPPHILERFFPLLPAYNNLDNPENFTQLVADVCKLIEYNPVPWEGANLQVPAIIARCRKPLLTEVFRVIYEMRAESENARIWICKSLVNIRFADQLEDNGVNPLYIHLFRDGRDVALSFKKAIVGEKQIYHIAKQWKNEQEASLQLAEKIGGNRVVKVRYEDLIANPEKELMKICRFMGADYNPVALDYYHSEESHKTAHSGVMWENVEKP
ncbi:MAG: sulfotransferase family protein, partial [Bacteroidales bacterium]